MMALFGIVAMGLVWDTASTKTTLNSSRVLAAQVNRMDRYIYKNVVTVSGQSQVESALFSRIRTRKA